MTELNSTKKTSPRLFSHLVTAIAIAVTIMAAPIIPAFADSSTTFSGRAIGVSVKSTILNVDLADTTPLPSQGGELDATVLHVQNQLAQADVLLSVTMGFDSTAQSTAATSDLTLLPGTANQVTAEFVRSDSQTTCTGATGSSEIANLKIGGQQVSVTGQPNQTIVIPGVLTLIINEQITSSSAGTNAITVNALDLKVATGAQVIVSSAHSDITCGTTQQSVTKDFMTGGGFIVVNNEHANFGFVAGYKPQQTTPSVQLNYMDHNTGMHVQSTSITSYGGSGNTRTFSGGATINGQSGFTFTVTATDNGNPGAGKDSFSIQLSNGYSASGVLGGGNIQLHS